MQSHTATMYHVAPEHVALSRQEAPLCHKNRHSNWPFALAARLEEAQRGNEMEVFTCEAGTWLSTFLCFQLTVAMLRAQIENDVDESLCWNCGASNTFASNPWCLNASQHLAGNYSRRTLGAWHGCGSAERPWCCTWTPCVYLRA